jgi:hypothetical protein
MNGQGQGPNYFAKDAGTKAAGTLFCPRNCEIVGTYSYKLGGFFIRRKLEIG